MNPADRRSKSDDIAKPNINQARTAAVEQDGGRTSDLIGQFDEKGVPVRNNSHVANYRFIYFGVERLIFTRADWQPRKTKEALQKPLFPSRIEQNCSVRFFFTTSKNGVFLPSK